MEIFLSIAAVVLFFVVIGLMVWNKKECRHGHDWYVVMDGGFARWKCSRCGDIDN